MTEYSTTDAAAPSTLAPPWTSRSADVVVPARRADVRCEPLDDEVIVTNPSDGSIHRLNSTAVWVWFQCDGHATTRQIADRLTRYYDVDFDTALDHVDQLVACFAELELFETACS